MSSKLRILVLISTYLPGYKSGGPLRTVSSMAHYLGDDFDFFVLTADRDTGEKQQYTNILINAWQKVGKANVYYVSPEAWNLIGIFRVIKDIDYDIIYLNSLFAKLSIYYLLLRRLRLVPRKQVVLAPRGETDPGAIALKSIKKRIYIRCSKLLGLYEHILWQASSEYEAKNILTVFSDASIHIAQDLALPTMIPSNGPNILKDPGSAHILYLSRITHKKNLYFALECLARLQYPVSFDIYGPISDETYWKRCQNIIERLPSHIKARYCGVVPHEEVSYTMRKYHALFLPTLGENFGHVIIEAFHAGCLVLTSDRTPWRSLASLGVGWDIPLESTQLYIAALNDLIALDNLTFKERSISAINYGQQRLFSSEVLMANRDLFVQAHHLHQSRL